MDYVEEKQVESGLNYEDYVDYLDWIIKIMQIMWIELWRLYGLCGFNVDYVDYVDYVEEKQVESGLNYEGTKTHRAHPPLSSSLIQ